MNIAEALWGDVEARVRHSPCALVPVGAVEVDGPHRDQASEGFLGDATFGSAVVGREIADRCVGQLLALLACEFGERPRP